MNNLLKNSRKCFSELKKRFLIIGGGDGGSGVAAILGRTFKKEDITILDPSQTYTYQSGQTMVGSGLKKREQIVQSMKNRHKRFDFVNAGVKKILPKENKVVTDEGREIQYDVLVISTGINPDKDSIKGLREALEDKKIPVASNYWMDGAEKMDRIRLNFTGGRAVFT